MGFFHHWECKHCGQVGEDAEDMVDLFGKTCGVFLFHKLGFCSVSPTSFRRPAMDGNLMFPVATF